MKLKITFIGILIIGAGLLPLLNALNMLPDALSLSNLIYSIIITLVGVLGLYMDLSRGSMSFMSVGQKFVTGIVAVLTILGGLYPVLVNLGVLQAIVPTKGTLYPGIIIGIGALGLFYGLSARR